MRSYDSAPRTPPPPLPSANCLSFSVFLCVAGLAYWQWPLVSSPDPHSTRSVMWVKNAGEIWRANNVRKNNRIKPLRWSSDALKASSEGPGIGISNMYESWKNRTTFLSGYHSNSHWESRVPHPNSDPNKPILIPNLLVCCTQTRIFFLEKIRRTRLPIKKSFVEKEIRTMNHEKAQFIMWNKRLTQSL